MVFRVRLPISLPAESDQRGAWFLPRGVVTGSASSPTFLMMVPLSDLSCLPGVSRPLLEYVKQIKAEALEDANAPGSRQPSSRGNAPLANAHFAHSKAPSSAKQPRD